MAKKIEFQFFFELSPEACDHLVKSSSGVEVPLDDSTVDDECLIVLCNMVAVVKAIRDAQNVKRGVV